MSAPRTLPPVRLRAVVAGVLIALSAAWAAVATRSTMLLAGPPQGEVVLQQTNPVQPYVWEPMLADFHLRSGQGSLKLRDGGEPVLEDDALVKVDGKTGLRLVDFNSATAEMPVSDLLSDWAQLLKRADEPPSGWVTALKDGQPRIHAHRPFNEDRMAVYRKNVRLLVALRVVSAREELPIPGNPTGEERDRKLAAGIKVVQGKLTYSFLDGVKAIGTDGRPSTTQAESSTNLPGGTIAEFGRTTLSEYIPRVASVVKGDRIDGVLRVQVELEVEAGKDLGVDPPARKKLAGEIRIVIADETLDITKISNTTRRP